MVKNYTFKHHIVPCEVLPTAKTLRALERKYFTLRKSARESTRRIWSLYEAWYSSSNPNAHQIANEYGVSLRSVYTNIHRVRDVLETPLPATPTPEAIEEKRLIFFKKSRSANKRMHWNIYLATRIHPVMSRSVIAEIYGIKSLHQIPMIANSVMEKVGAYNKRDLLKQPEIEAEYTLKPF